MKFKILININLFIVIHLLAHDDLPAMDNINEINNAYKSLMKQQLFLAGDALLTEAFLIIAKSDKIKAEKALIIANYQVYGVSTV